MGIMLSIPMLIAGLYLLFLSMRPNALAPALPSQAGLGYDAEDVLVRDVPEAPIDPGSPAPDTPAAGRTPSGA
jgi:hypothetical protein